MVPRRALLGLMVVAPLGALLGCDTTSVNVEVSRTSTVAVGSARAVRFTVPALVDVVGTPVGSDLIITLSGVVTASTSSRAQAAAEAIRIEVSRSDPNIADVTLAGLDANARFSGTMEARVPAGLDLSVSAEPGARVADMLGNVELRTSGGAEVSGVRGSLSIVTSGGAAVTTPLLQSTRLAIRAEGGVTVHLPTTPSAVFAVTGASVSVRHPRLPGVASPATQYRQTVNGGLAEVQITSNAAVSLEP